MHAARKLPPKKYLQECFDYDWTTGILYWKSRPRKHFKSEKGFLAFNSKYPGRAAFTTIDNGYLRGALNGQPCRAHRVVWKLITGSDPSILDHANNNRKDNRFSNLREADFAANARNARLRKDSVSGLKGVSFDNTNGKWLAQIRVDGRTKYLGHFVDSSEAHQAYKTAAKTFHREFANFGQVS
ncbi:MAG: hypothetical protein MOGMAGMI_02560 [Candidatus Omnitrophica bacterium]|nr:hypothetical protein [Candidatus Omnitrophota bacterium]